MNWQSWLQLGLVVVALGVTTPLLGRYMARVFGGGAAPGDRVFGPIERLAFRIGRIDPEAEQRWTVYAYSLLAFSLVSVLLLYLIQRLQGVLPLNPNAMSAVGQLTAFNTAVSFVTNTNWQSYSGESTMSHLTQMAGLAVQNFASAAVGLAVAVALIRGLVRRRSQTVGNFWVDLVRSVLRILLPLALVAALALAGLGVVQNLAGNKEVTTLQRAGQSIPGGPVASQEAIKELGTNGGGFYNANSAHPFENPTPLTNVLEIYLLLCIPFALCWTFGELAGDRRQGFAVLAAMVLLWAGSAAAATYFELQGNAALTPAGVDQRSTADQPGGNLEGKEVRFGTPASALFAASTTGTSTGAVDSAHDSYTPLGGMVPMVNMMLGEVSPGGVGAGLYGMLIFALLAVFIAGLMVGRTPEYLGKSIGAAEMKLVVVYILIVPLVVLGFAAASILLRSVTDGSILNTGPHGLSEVVYAVTSAGNNNGSAFGGLTASTDWFNVVLGLCMLCGRFLLIVPALAIAGSLGRKPAAPATSGTFPTYTPTFTVLLVAVVLIVVGLAYFPVLSLGPIVEHLGL